MRPALQKNQLSILSPEIKGLNSMECLTIVMPETYKVPRMIYTIPTRSVPVECNIFRAVLNGRVSMSVSVYVN